MNYQFKKITDKNSKKYNVSFICKVCQHKYHIKQLFMDDVCKYCAGNAIQHIQHIVEDETSGIIPAGLCSKWENIVEGNR